MKIDTQKSRVHTDETPRERALRHKVSELQAQIEAMKREKTTPPEPKK